MRNANRNAGRRWMIATMMIAGVIVGGAAPNGRDARAEPTRIPVVSTSAGNGAPDLFSPFAIVPGKALEAVNRGPQVVRFRTVEVDRAMLTKPGSTSAVFGPTTPSLPAQQSITLNLFDDVSLVADVDRIEPTSGGIAWIGRVRGVDMSDVILVVDGDVVAGNVSMPGARYHIRYGKNGGHEIQEIDQSKFPPDEHGVRVSPEPSPDSAPVDVVPAPGKAVQVDDGSIIDVMVVYTATTRAASGNSVSMRAEIDLAVAETNQSYVNSGVNQRVRLVHAEEVSYKEPGNLDDPLDCITNTSDGCLDYLHGLRDLYAADLVSFWVEDAGDICGLGWWRAPQVIPARGFSAVARSCATGVYSFGHEMGHNMGAQHDVYVEPSTSDNPYGHGFVNVSGGWRTVMAYNNACADAGKNCTRIQYWSNPNLAYKGSALGNSTADNRRTLNNSAFAVANFRNDTYVRPNPPSGSGNYVANPGFESGPGAWVQNVADLIWNDSGSSHSGGWTAWLGFYNNANHVLYQDIAIPAGATAASLQFWYRITTTETTTTMAYDFGTVDVVDAASGAVLVNLGTLSNLNVTNGWVQSTPTDLTALRGKTVRVRFRVTTDENKGTSFFFDDVALNVTASAATGTVVEFYNANLDNFFITSNTAEATAIDGGAAGPGWARTGAAFNFNAGGDTSVCRFYGSISPGPNSHFYTVSAAECNALKAQQATTPASQPRWNFESLDFLSSAPVNGACPAGKVPVYRAYNNGAARKVDSNHRITTNASGISAVVAKGWINEGVVMCAPQ